MILFKLILFLCIITHGATDVDFSEELLEQFLPKDFKHIATLITNRTMVTGKNSPMSIQERKEHLAKLGASLNKLFDLFAEASGGPQCRKTVEKDAIRFVAQLFVLGMKKLKNEVCDDIQKKKRTDMFLNSFYGQNITSNNKQKTSKKPTLKFGMGEYMHQSSFVKNPFGSF